MKTSAHQHFSTTDGRVIVAGSQWNSAADEVKSRTSDYIKSGMKKTEAREKAILDTARHIKSMIGSRK